MSDFKERLKEKFHKILGYEWNGYTAPECQPNIQSRQVKALAEMVEELELRVKDLEAAMVDIGRKEMCR